MGIRKDINGSFRGLMAAAVTLAIDDLEDTRLDAVSLRNKDSAMTFILGPDCEAYCVALDADYKAIREKAASLYREFLEDDPAMPKPVQRRSVQGLPAGGASTGRAIKNPPVAL
jgi:hypothetical protein